IAQKNFPLARQAMHHLTLNGIEAQLIVARDRAHDEIPLYMNASNVLLLTSVHEGSPNVVKEAMACNIPIVATDVGDVRQVIGRTEGGSVCPAEPQALARGLERALHHRGPTTGRADIEHLDNIVIARRLVALYRELTGRPA